MIPPLNDPQETFNDACYSSPLSTASLPALASFFVERALLIPPLDNPRETFDGACYSSPLSMASLPALVSFFVERALAIPPLNDPQETFNGVSATPFRCRRHPCRPL